MVNDNNSLPLDLWRILWRERAFQWFRENRQYNDFNLDSCLNILKGNATKREAAFSAFWSVYLANDIPPTLGDTQLEQIKQLLEAHPLQNYQVEDLKDLAFVKLHLAGILTTCLIHPDYPVCENPGLITTLEKVLEACSSDLSPDVSETFWSGIQESRKDYRDKFSEELFNRDPLQFSVMLVRGIIGVELSFIRNDQRRYEDAFTLITNYARDIYAITIEEKFSFSETMRYHREYPGFTPYLPHSGCQFDIQEVANIFENIKINPREIRNWNYIIGYCDALKFLGYCGLYDIHNELVEDSNGEEFRGEEYWGRASIFAEERMRLVDSPYPVVTRDMMKQVETEDRLKRDFFPETWEELPEDARKIFVDAEIEWMHDKPDKMVQEIRPILEIALPSVFPFLQLGPKEKGDQRLDLTRMKDAILSNPVVRAAINGVKISNEDKQWAMKDLPEYLIKIIRTRNYFQKDIHKETSSENKREMREKAISLCRELVGIGCRGILPRLMEIKKATHPK